MIVHSSIDEKKHAIGGKAGDQTSREVYTTKWYNKPWEFMLRYPNANIASKVAKIAVKLANSNLVGYDQSQRMTLYKALKANNWDVDKYIKSGVKTESDCSSFIYTCFCCLVPSMRSDSNGPRTYTMREKYKGWGFKVYTDSKYLKSEDYLLPGDILVKSAAHTVMEISTGSKTVITPKPVTKPTNVSTPKPTTKSKIEGAQHKIKGYEKGKNFKATANLRLRVGAGDNKTIIKVLDKGSTVTWYGYYTTVKGVKWYLVVDSKGDTGFVSSKYVK